jgi:hypothetical protein
MLHPHSNHSNTHLEQIASADGQHSTYLKTWKTTAFHYPIHTYILTPHSTVLLEKLTNLQVVK